MTAVVFCNSMSPMTRGRVLHLFWALCAWSACSTEPEPIFAREVSSDLQIDALGFSEPLEFAIPSQTRSITIIAEGAEEDLLGLAVLTLSDGRDLVAVDLTGSLGPIMSERYFNLQSGRMPGELAQSIRLGTFTHVYPYAPGLDLPSGEARLRIASTATGGMVKVRVLMPEEDGGNVLHVNVLRVAGSSGQEFSTAFVAEVETIVAAAGLELVVDEVVEVLDSDRARITDFSEPQETPSSQSASLAVWGQSFVTSDAVTIYLVDSLPFGVGGLALGTPGPPDSMSYYFGVVARYGADSEELGRIVSHELAHFIQLQHVENRDLLGTVLPDPISDTEPGQGNLMEQGTLLTAGQSFALLRSSLLSVE